MAFPLYVVDSAEESGKSILYSIISNNFVYEVIFMGEEAALLMKSRCKINACLSRKCLLMAFSFRKRIIVMNVKLLLNPRIRHLSHKTKLNL